MADARYPRLIPQIGYDEVVKIGKAALTEDITLKEAAAKLGFWWQETSIAG